MRTFGTIVATLALASAAHAQDFARPDAGVAHPAERERGEPPASEYLAAPLPEAEDKVIVAEVVQSRQEIVREAAVAERAQFHQGSFWWYVGIIVVAGVILAVVL